MAASTATKAMNAGHSHAPRRLQRKRDSHTPSIAETVVVAGAPDAWHRSRRRVAAARAEE
jgi:hypothetical protein